MKKIILVLDAICIVITLLFLFYYNYNESVGIHVMLIKRLGKQLVLSKQFLLLLLTI